MASIEADADLPSAFNAGHEAVFAETLAAGVAKAEMGTELAAPRTTYRTVRADQFRFGVLPVVLCADRVDPQVGATLTSSAAGALALA